MVVVLVDAEVIGVVVVVFVVIGVILVVFVVIGAITGVFVVKRFIVVAFVVLKFVLAGLIRGCTRGGSFGPAAVVTFGTGGSTFAGTLEIAVGFLVTGGGTFATEPTRGPLARLLEFAFGGLGAGPLIVETVGRAVRVMGTDRSEGRLEIEFKGSFCKEGTALDCNARLETLRGARLDVCKVCALGLRPGLEIVVPRRGFGLRLSGVRL